MRFASLTPAGADWIVGLSSAGLLLPEAVAYSGIAGAPPQAGVIALFAGLLANPVKLIGWHSAFMLLNFVVVAGGITGGIERANKILMPALFAILLIVIFAGGSYFDLFPLRGSVM